MVAIVAVSVLNSGKSKCAADGLERMRKQRPLGPTTHGSRIAVYDASAARHFR